MMSVHVHHADLAELPPVSTLVAEDESGHGFVGTSGLHLAVGAVALLAFSTLDEVSLGALHHRHLRIVYCFFSQLQSQLLQLSRRHLVRSHRRQCFRRYFS